MIIESNTLTTKGRQHIKETNFAVPPNHPKNKDDKGHYPVHDKAHAENAVARVMQQTKAPVWWSGTLEELKNTVSRKAHGKYRTQEDKQEKKSDMNKNIINKLASISKELDYFGDFESSDSIMKVMGKMAHCGHCDEDKGSVRNDQIGTVNRDQWVPANKGTEKPFKIKGRRLQYMWNR